MLNNTEALKLNHKCIEAAQTVLIKKNIIELQRTWSSISFVKEISKATKYSRKRRSKNCLNMSEAIKINSFL